MNIFFTRRHPADGSLARLAFPPLMHWEERKKSLGFVYLWGGASFELESEIQTGDMDFKNTETFVTEKRPEEIITWHRER